MNATLHIYALKRTIFDQKIKQMICPIKMAAKLPIFIFASFRFWQNFEKKTLSKINFWLTTGNYE